MVAIFFDVIDGKLARLLGLTSRFGTEFDSLADTISFCAVPSILVYSLYVDGLSNILIDIFSLWKFRTISIVIWIFVSIFGSPIYENT